MSIEVQGHFFTIYFLGFECFVLYKAKISGERLQDHWSSGFDNMTKNLPSDNLISLLNEQNIELSMVTVEPGMSISFSSS